jgi:hypothetical protein
MPSNSYGGGDSRFPSESTGTILNLRCAGGRWLWWRHSKIARTSESDRRRTVAISLETENEKKEGSSWHCLWILYAWSWADRILSLVIYHTLLFKFWWERDSIRLINIHELSGHHWELKIKSNDVASCDGRFGLKTHVPSRCGTSSFHLTHGFVHEWRKYPLCGYLIFLCGSSVFSASALWLSTRSTGPFTYS